MVTWGIAKLLMGNRPPDGCGGARTHGSGVGLPWRFSWPNPVLAGHPGTDGGDRCEFIEGRSMWAVLQAIKLPQSRGSIRGTGGCVQTGAGGPFCGQAGEFSDAGKWGIIHRMAIHLKTPEEIEKMRIAGRLAAEVLDIITPHVKPGVTTEELDRICNDHIVNVQGTIPANVGYRGFPKTVCTSVNNVICHGIPSETKVLKDGDIINIDVTVIKDGWHGDTSRMYYVGTPSVMARRLVETTREAMWRGIRAVKPGATLGD